MTRIAQVARRRPASIASALALTVATLAIALAGTALARTVHPRGHRRAAVTAANGSTALIVMLAQRELAKNVHEIPDGSNRSPDIWRYDRATSGSVFGAPWCAYFASYIARQAGVPIGYHGLGIGYVPYIRAWARATGRERRVPQAGYLITFPEHVGIVEHVYSDHTLSSIEGNAGNAVRREYHRWSEAVDYVKIASDSGAGIQPTDQPKPAATTVAQPLRARIHVYPSTTATVGEPVQFTSQDSSGNPVKEAWSFGEDGRVDASGQNVSHSYARAGVYTVHLQLTDRKRHTSDATVQLRVDAAQPPQAGLSLGQTTVHPGDTVSMDAGSSGSAGSQIVRYEWDYVGNGAYTDGGDHSSHRYDAPGTYVVHVRVTDGHGLQAIAAATVNVVPWSPPVALISCSRTELSSLATIRCSSDDSHSPYRIQSHTWDPGDGSSYLRGQTVTYAWRHPGTYTIHMQVVDSHGSAAVASAQIQVDDLAPVARITPPHSIRLNAAASFDGSGSSDADGQIVRYEWDDGTGAGYQQGGSTLTRVYVRPGTYTVRLRVTDDFGATTVATYQFTVADLPPVASITPPASPVHGSPVTISGSGSTDPDDTIATYEWDVGGGFQTGTSQLTTTYPAAGSYTVRLRVTDGWGATSTTQTVVVAR